MSRRASDAFAAKQRRQKVIAVVGGVMLLGVLAIQGPRMWKQMHPSTPAAPPTATPTTPTSAPANPGAASPAPSSPTLVAARAPRSASIAGTAIPAQAPLAPGEGLFPQQSVNR